MSCSVCKFAYSQLQLQQLQVLHFKIGNTIALNLSRRWEHKFIDWKKKYGKIFTYWVGELPIVSVSDYELAHKLFVKEADAFADRCAPEHFLRYTRAGHVSGVIFTSGHLWQDQRRFALRILKDFGLGKNDMEHKVNITIVLNAN